MSAQPTPAGRGEPMWRHWIVGGVASTGANLINGRAIRTAYRLPARATPPPTPLPSPGPAPRARPVPAPARHPPFSRRLFQRHGVDPANVSPPAELGELFTTPQDLIDHPAEDFLCRPPQVLYETSGTSRRRKTIYYSHQEVEAATSLMAVRPLPHG